MHANSQIAMQDITTSGAKARRSAVILRWLVAHPRAYTDREIAAGMGFPDMNCVRPRITELVEAGLLREQDSVRCPVTGKTVRRVTPVQLQSELPL